jgi:gamma-glutamyltranspeptidase
VDEAYLAERAGLLDPSRALETVEPGEPEWDHAMLWGDDVSLELPSTSHISIVDAEGNALSMTTTIENGFGSRLFVRGFLLNNELTDFSFATHENGWPIANRVEPGKRPRSSMAPTIVMRDGAPVLVVGSPGGSQIIGYVAQESSTISTGAWTRRRRSRAASRQPLRHLRSKPARCGRPGRGVAGGGLRDERHRPDERPTRHRHRGRPAPRRRRSAARGHRDRRVNWSAAGRSSPLSAG